MRRLLALMVMALAVVVAGSLGGVAFAAEQNMKAGGLFGDGPCAADFTKFCKEVKPGDEHIMQCMKEHAKDLSPECKADLRQKKEQKNSEGNQKQSACKEDVEMFCKDVQPGGGRLIQCLKKHSAELSPACQDTLKK